jgi:hypothetical protein
MHEMTYTPVVCRNTFTPHVLEAPWGNGRAIADRPEDEPCQRGTVGCCVDHTAERTDHPSTTPDSCETW